MDSGLNSVGKETKVQWYVAELVLSFKVEGDDRGVVHKNLMLIEARSPEEAFDKAISIGKDHQMSYKNPQGARVDVRFMGLSKLNVVYDRLEDGAELLYEEYVSVPDTQICGLVVPKDMLAVFRSESRPSGPDYSCGEVLDEASMLLESCRELTKEKSGSDNEPTTDN